MPYNGIADFVRALEKENELLRVSLYVNPLLEIAECTDRMSKSTAGGKALFFENTGSSIPVVTNMLGSERRMCMALGVSSFKELSLRVQELLDMTMLRPKSSLREKIILFAKALRLLSYAPRYTKKKGVCQEIVHQTTDLSILPVLKCWPHDGGRFITLPIVHTKDPYTGMPNAGMYRMQLFSKDTTGMHWHPYKGGAAHFAQWKKKKQRMPIAVTLGGDPVYTYVATAPLPENIDEYLLAGFLRKKSVKMVKCITQDIYVPEDADIVLEGYVDPEEELVWEGPFGDHTGFYSLPEWFPKFHITCISQRKDAVYPATLVGIPPQEDYYIAKVTEHIFVPLIRKFFVPELIAMRIPCAGVGHNIVLASIEKMYPAQAQKVMYSLWGAGQMIFNKVLILLPASVDLADFMAVAKVVSTNVDVPRDIYLHRGPLDILDHATDTKGKGGKLCIDATMPAGNPKYDMSADCSFLHNIEGIVAYNDSLLSSGVSVFFVFMEKKYAQQTKQLAEKIFSYKEFNTLKFLVIMDAVFAKFDFFLLAWMASANLNPEKDVWCEQNKHVVLDCTKKSQSVDGFMDNWPDIVLSDSHTIQSIDMLAKTLHDNLPDSPSAAIRRLLA